MGVRLVLCQKCENFQKKKKKKRDLHFCFCLHWAVKWSGRMHVPLEGPQPTTCTASYLLSKAEWEWEKNCLIFLFFIFVIFLFCFVFAMQMIIKKHWSASLCCDTSICHQRAAFNLWLNSSDQSPTPNIENL